MDTNNTKYQITKTVRFKLEAVNEGSAESEFKPSIDSDTTLSSFYNDLDGVLIDVKKLLLKLNEGSPEYIDEESYAFKKEIYVRYDFLMAYVKRDFFAARLRTKEKFYQVDKHTFLAKKITEVLQNIEMVKEKLFDYQKCEPEEQKRRAEIAYWINRLDNRFNFQFIHELIKSIDDKKFADSSLKNLLVKLDDFKEKIVGMKAMYLPAQSNGSLVATSSLNYYTVERTPKQLESVDVSSDNGEYSLTTEYNKVNKRNQSKIFESIYLIGKSDSKFLLPKVVNEKKIGPNWSTVLEKIKNCISYLSGKNQAKVAQLTNLQSIVSDCERYNYPFINITKYFKDKKMQINLKAADNTINEVAAFFIDFDRSDCLDDKYKPLFPDGFGKKLHDLFSTKKTYTIDELLIHFSLEEAYFFLKCWRKSIVKANFTQNVYKYLSDKTEEYEKKAIFESLKAFDLYRMSDKDLNNYIEQTKKIKEISNEINQSKQRGNFSTEKLQNRLQEECDKRNSILTKQPLYDSFCKFYKDVAMEYGKNKALKKSIEKENNTAVQLNYWSFISEGKGERFVYFIPRNSDKNYKDAKKALMDNKVQLNGVDTIYYFESLTLHALRKLCFNNINDNTFRKSLTYILPPCEQTKRVSYFDQGKRKYKNVPNTDYDKIQIYVNVLKDGGSIKNQLANYLKLKKEVLDVFDNNREATLADFETKLNQFCYRKVAYLNRNADAILKDNTIPYFKFKIELPHKNNVKKDYTHLLTDFFSPDNENSDYTMRLNPEIKLFRRDANPDFGAWYDCGKEGDKRNETRFEKARYTLALTFTEHADAKKVDYSFATDTKGEQKLDAKVRNIQQNIDKFNEAFSDENWKFALGIDVGTNEGLAYITTCDGNGNPKPFDVLEINEECKNGSNNLVKKNGNEAIFMQNPSYYLNEDLFKHSFSQTYSRDNYAHKSRVCAIDLTTAKVFSLNNSGKDKMIVLDSDYSTHLNLKKINAQIAMSARRKEDPECEFIIQEDTEKPERVFVVSKELAKKYAETGNYNLIKDCSSIYDYNEKYDNLKSRREIFNEIKTLERQLGNENLEENINKVKKNMVANMVGVIYHLYHQLKKQFGEDAYGLIVFEGLDAGEIEGHSKRSKVDITLSLRNALLKKFQNDLLVQPYKEISKLTDVQKFKDSNQYGVVHYVSKDNTSKICPICDEIAFTGDHDGNFSCRNCHITLDDKQWNWDNVDEDKIAIDKCDSNIELFSSIDCNDKIAAFNIARRGLGFV